MSTSTTDARARAPRIPCPWHGWRRTARLGVAVLACTFAGAGQAQDDYPNLDRAVDDLAERLVGRGNLEGKQVLVRPGDFFEMRSERSLPLSEHLAWKFSTDLRRYGAKPVSGSADESRAITLQGRWRIESGSGMLLLSVEVKQLAGPGLNERRVLATRQARVPVASIDETHLEPDLESHGRYVVRQLERRIEMHLSGNRKFHLHIRPFSADDVSDPNRFNRYLLGKWRPAFADSPVFVTGVGTAQLDGELHGDVYVTGRRIEAHLFISDDQGREVAAATVEMDKGLFPLSVVGSGDEDDDDVPDITGGQTVPGSTSVGGSSGSGEVVSGVDVRLEQCARHVEAKRSADAVKCYADVLKETPGDTQALAGLEGLAGTKFRDCDECPELVVVPSGTYKMGSKRGNSDEKPVRDVRIGYPLAVGVFEVTFGEWDACVSEGGCGGYRPDDEGWGRGPRPVVNVSWDDAQAYVGWLSEKTGQAYRLLSESEWEYVARAGTRTGYWWGDETGRNRANCAGCGSRWDNQKTAPVGSFPANAFGLHDVHGNVWEWVENCYIDGYAGAPVNGSAWEWNCDRRVLRGGSWFNIPWYLRSAIRDWNSTGLRDTILGFRIARTLTP